MSIARPAAVLALGLLLAACADTATSGRSDVAPSSATREALTQRIDEMVRAGRFGGEAWRLSLSERYGQPTFARRVIVDGDLLLIQDQNHEIHALDRKTGVHVFVVGLPGPLTQDVGSTPSTLSFVTTDELVAVERSSGARLMERPSNHLDFFPSGRAVTIGGSSYVGRMAPYSVQAIEARGNFEGWAYGTASTVMDLIVYGDGPTAQVVGSTDDGLLFSLPPRAANESKWAPTENWHRRLATTRACTPLTLSGISLFFGSENGSLYRLDARSGIIQWKVPVGEGLRGNQPVAAGGAVYVACSGCDVCQGSVTAIKADTGATLWVCEGAKRLVTQIGDRCYVEMPDGISVRKANSGAEIATFATAGLVLPTIQGGGALIACDESGGVFAIE